MIKSIANNFKKIILYFAALIFCSLAGAVEVQYYKSVKLHGLLTERSGVDCCKGGEERVIKFPVIQLKSPINVVSKNPAKPELDEVPEKGVTLMQLIMDDNSWKIYKKLKGKSAHVYCEPFHAFNGHHLTAVLCDVQLIAKD